MRSRGDENARMIRTLSSPDKTAILVPSELNDARVHAGWLNALLPLAITAISRPESAAQSLTVRSCDDAVTTYRPFGLNAALSTAPWWPRRTTFSLPSRVLQIRLV